MTILGYLQRIGKALMMPVAILPAAAILIGIGYWIDPETFGSSSPIAAVLFKSGAAIIDNMALLFAIGIAYGMSKDKDGAAALAGYVGFTIIVTLLHPTTVAQILQIDPSEVSPAFEKINTQFVGILMGVITAAIYNRYYQVELPKALAFFNGKRLVPIITSLAAIIVSGILLFIWPAVYSGLYWFGGLIENMGAAGAGIYAFFNRLLIPIGLHHALNSVFWFDVAGINDLPNFLGGQLSIDNGDAIPGVTGMYMAGFFPIMMFGLPGAALAIYHTAKPENKAKVGAIMMAAAFASFFTGISEPIEFSFMFVAPILYFAHAVLTGISVFIAASFEWISGFGFSAGIIDMILQSRNPLAVQWYMLIVQGLIFFTIYYVVFRTLILKLKLLTPGREDDVETTDSNNSAQKTKVAESKHELANQYLTALGGRNNLTEIDACITRLRLQIKDKKQVNEAELKRLGAQAVLFINNTSVQVIVGTLAEILAANMNEISKTTLNQNITHQNITSSNITQENITPQNINSQDINSQDITQDITKQNKTQADSIIKSLGHINNISSIKTIAYTRLLVKIKDTKQVNEEQLKQLNISLFIEQGNNLQLIIGPNASIIANIINSKL